MKKIISPNPPPVTFIIPTLNASKTLPRCLDAIRSQDYPQSRIEIIVADGGSRDNTRRIASSFSARVIDNPDVLHEHGKSRASLLARGKILFYTDADNVLSHPQWVKRMVQPYMDDPAIMGFLPQTIPALDTNSLDRYMGYLFTDPFTWFVYYPAANPADYERVYPLIRKTDTYTVFRFPKNNYPLFGLSQGVGTNRLFKRDTIAYADDLLAGIKLMRDGGLVAYVPDAGVYHYHVKGLGNFIKKYRWRIRNNIRQDVTRMGITQRTSYFSLKRRIRMYLFPLYGISVIFPLIDAVRLSMKYRDTVMLLHLPVSFLLSLIIMSETLGSLFAKRSVGEYE